MKKVGVLSLAATTVLMAGGYSIPEQSVNAVGLSGAYVAHANGADATYYNPANMVFNEDGGFLEIDLTYIHLTAINATGTYGGFLPYDIESEKENFIIPTMHYVSPAVNDFRFGLSLVAPGGLAKRWNEAPGSWSAKEFSLTTYEINPTVAYKVNDQFSIGVGLRGVYSSGKIIIDATTVPNPAANPYYDLKADGFDFGYNFALNYRPISELSLAATYRSKVELNLDGDATLTYPTGVPVVGGATFDDSGKTSIPLPAVSRLAAAYTFNEATTVEFVYERNYWSEYKKLDIEFGTHTLLNINQDKNWEDAQAYRLGVSHVYNSDWTVMAGMVYDESPIPDESLSFELPGSDGMVYSVGTRYMLSEEVEVGASFFYLDKKSRTVNQAGGIDGTFTDAAAYFLTLGVEYRF